MHGHSVPFWYLVSCSLWFSGRQDTQVGREENIQLEKYFVYFPHLNDHSLHNICKNNIDNVNKSRGKAISVLCSYTFLGQTLLLEIMYNSWLGLLWVLSSGREFLVLFFWTGNRKICITFPTTVCSLLLDSSLMICQIQKYIYIGVHYHYHNVNSSAF